MRENFPWQCQTEKSVSVKVVCVGISVNINKLPHKYLSRAIGHREGKTLLGSEGMLPLFYTHPSPAPSLPGVLTNASKGMTLHLTFRNTSYGEATTCGLKCKKLLSVSTGFLSTSEFFACVGRGAHSLLRATKRRKWPVEI